MANTRNSNNNNNNNNHNLNDNANLQRFMGHGENTMGAVVSSSIAMVLLKLLDRYATELDAEKMYHACVQEIKHSVSIVARYMNEKIPQDQQKIAIANTEQELFGAIENMLQIVQEGFHPTLDQITVFLPVSNSK